MKGFLALTFLLDGNLREEHSLAQVRKSVGISHEVCKSVAMKIGVKWPRLGFLNPLTTHFSKLLLFPFIPPCCCHTDLFPALSHALLNQLLDNDGLVVGCLQQKSSCL